MKTGKPFVLSVRLQREKIASYETYPFSLPAIRNFEQIDFHAPVTFIIGENGSGKSALLEAIAAALGFNPEGGSRNFRFTTRASHSRLSEYLRVARSARRPRNGYFLLAESFFNVASEIERLDAEPGPGARIIASYGGRSLHEQSHGESFMTLLTERFGDDGLYVLDEPEATLSPMRQMAALRRIHEPVNGGSHFIIATHSPILMAYPDAQLLLIENGEIRPVAYTETEHFLVARRFINHYREVIADLLAE